jgi:hypothetical protein
MAPTRVNYVKTIVPLMVMKFSPIRQMVTLLDANPPNDSIWETSPDKIKMRRFTSAKQPLKQ